MGRDKAHMIGAERLRITAEYDRRQREIESDRYAPWQPAEMLMLQERKRISAGMLREADVFPKIGDKCLEIGCGTLGWLGDLITWGCRQEDLAGIELNPARAEKARAALPLADLRTGDAIDLPWDDSAFDLVIVSTVFTSILSNIIRELIAAEIIRVLKPGGALLWYDFAVNNPGNPNVQGISRRELQHLFPLLSGKTKSLCLVPPLARLIAPHSWTLAVALSAIPFLRTHLLAVLIKNRKSSCDDNQ